MKPTVLMFNIPEAKRNAIGTAALRLGIRVLTVPPEKFGCGMGSLFSDKTVPCPGEIGGEMLVLCDVPPRRLDPLLDGLRKAGATVALKAVLTETNREWSGERLYGELNAERAAFDKAKSSVHCPEA